MGLLDRFTKQAKQVLSRAQEEARYFNHPYVGTEHLLLALIGEHDNIASQVLDDLGATLPVARRAVEFIVGRGEDRPPSDEIELTARAKKVLEHAVDEARKHNHHYVGPEHILLGLVRNGEGVATGVLEILQVSLKDVRTQVERRFDGEPAQSVDPPTEREDAKVGAPGARVTHCELFPRDAAQTAAPGTATTFRFALTNLGSRAQVFHLEVAALPDAALPGVYTGLPEPRLGLEPGQMAWFDVVVFVPPPTERGEDVRRVRAISRRGDTPSAEAIIRTTVR